MLTAQEIFDKTAVHLLTQNKRAISETGCAFRAPGGLKCAVGCLIPDTHYEPRMELQHFRWAATALRAGGVEIREHEALLGGLMSVHDDSTPEDWPTELREVAKLHSLNTDVVDNFKPGV